MLEGISFFMGAIVTALYMIFSMITDLKERAVYVFPGWMLFVSWGCMGINLSANKWWYLMVLMIQLGIYAFLRLIKVWGEGDSDIFLLYGAVYGVFALKFGLGINMALLMFGEVVGLLIALAVSLQIGVIEALLRKRELNRKSSVAVVPGFSVVVVGMIAAMVIERVM